MEGYIKGVGINGYHWYGDPFNLYSNYSVDHFFEILGELNSTYNPPSLSNMAGISNQESMYFLYSTINSNEDSKPVPEPGSFLLLISFIILFSIKNIIFHNRKFNV